MKPLPDRHLLKLTISTRTETLWLDSRYYRCNSPVGVEQIWGAYEVPLIGFNDHHTPQLGSYWNGDYPRSEI